MRLTLSVSVCVCVCEREWYACTSPFLCVYVSVSVCVCVCVVPGAGRPCWILSVVALCVSQSRVLCVGRRDDNHNRISAAPSAHRGPISVTQPRGLTACSVPLLCLYHTRTSVAVLCCDANKDLSTLRHGVCVCMTISAAAAFSEEWIFGRLCAAVSHGAFAEVRST